MGGGSGAIDPSEYCLLALLLLLLLLLLLPRDM